MSVHLTQVTLAGKTQLATAHTPCRQVTIQSDAANTHTMRVGDTNVSATKGIILANSATAPGTITVGDTGGTMSINLDDFYAIGTDGEKVDILIVQ